MARGIEDKLAALRALDTSSPQAHDVLRDALASQTGIVVAAAAKRIADDAIETLVPELVDAFERLCTQGAKRDPGCRGKTAIARVLHQLDSWEERVFVAGLRIVQQEGWAGPGGGGERDDTAAELRGICGLAHAHFGRTDALDVLADLLVDTERVTRIAAAQAIGDSRRADGSALLRLKLHVGDTDPEVLSACVESMLALACESSLDFVLALLVEHDGKGEAAALALGGARVARAREPLVAWCMGAAPDQRRRPPRRRSFTSRSHAAGVCAVGALTRATRARRCDASPTHSPRCLRDEPLTQCGRGSCRDVYRGTGDRGRDTRRDRGHDRDGDEHRVCRGGCRGDRHGDSALIAVANRTRQRTQRAAR